MKVNFAPWRYSGQGQIIGNDGEPVAYLAGRLNDGDDDIAGRRMAAAPELYEALDQLLHEAIEAGFDTATDYGWPSSIAAARAALAKARGEP